MKQALAVVLLLIFSALAVQNCGGGATDLGTTDSPPRAEPAEAADSLGHAQATGLLGAPLPAGARLIERSEGDPANGVDPSERYQIQATTKQIMSFYDAAMKTAGWQIDQPVTPTARFFKKGRLMLGVLTNSEGGTFTLMGS